MKNDGRGRGAANRQARRERQAAYNQAIRESRVVRMAEGFRVYASAAEAEEAVKAAKALGFDANIVPAGLAL